MEENAGIDSPLENYDDDFYPETYNYRYDNNQTGIQSYMMSPINN